MTDLEKTDQTGFTVRVLLGLAVAGLVLYFMHLMSGLINNLFFAVIIAVMASPLLLWLRKKGAPNWLAFLVTLLAVAAGVFLVVVFVVNAAAELTTSIPKYIDEAEELQETLNAIAASIELFDLSLGTVLGLIEVRKVLQAVGTFAGGVLETFSSAAIITLFVIFLLVQYLTTPRLMREEILAGNTYLARIILYLSNLRQYFLITAAIGLVTGALDTVWFLILGIPNAFIWGGVAAILSFVPSIGFWLAAIPPTLLALFEYGPLTALITLVGILIINGIADNYIKPRYIGEGLDLAPFMVVFSVIFWALILGPAGAILGVPMTMLFKALILEPDERLSWMARIIGSGMTPPEEQVQSSDS